MKTLTLEQVRKAGRFAYQLTGGDEVPIYNPNTGDLAEIVPWMGVERYGESSNRHADSWTMGVEPRYNIEEHVVEADAADDWHHLPGCDCEFCA
jgi:hypothetical protein